MTSHGQSPAYKASSRGQLAGKGEYFAVTEVSFCFALDELRLQSSLKEVEW